MDDRTLGEIVKEFAPVLGGRALGKVFQLGRAAVALELRGRDGRHLFVAAEPGRPRLYLSARSPRELERSSLPPTPFALAARKWLAGATLASVTKDEGDRVVRLRFSARDALGNEHTPSLVAQLTGRTANLFLVDERGRVVDALRAPRGAGQEVGDLYEAPAAPSPGASREEPRLARGEFRTLSEAAEEADRRLAGERAFEQRAAALGARLRREAARRRKLEENLARDLARHGEAEAHRRAGDLLLANIATAERSGGVVRLFDYYAEGAPTIELEVDENRSLQEEAAARFTRYAKAKRAAEEIAVRLEATRRELAALESRRAALERVVAARDEAGLEALGVESGAPKRTQPGARGRGSKKEPENIPGVRRYRSSDGYEILVGRGARENDLVTFRVARSYDTWLHAADYPGSHVVVRNHRRGEDVPHRTLVEAAQLAAAFSQARKDSKVAVNYTQRKFISKPKGAAPGLVRLSGFKTMLVEPREAAERI